MLRLNYRSGSGPLDLGLDPLGLGLGLDLGLDPLDLDPLDLGLDPLGLDLANPLNISLSQRERERERERDRERGGEPERERGNERKRDCFCLCFLRNGILCSWMCRCHSNCNLVTSLFLLNLEAVCMAGQIT